MAEKRYLSASVYRTADGADCTNGGVSARENTIFIQCERGNILAEHAPPHLRFKAVQKSPHYWAAIPEDNNGQFSEDRKTHLCGPMFGGNLAATSDSRLPYVLHIHDRYETWEQYARMSR